MSNFDVNNKQHVVALSLIAAEVKHFGTVSFNAMLAASTFGLVPSDIDLLNQKLKTAIVNDDRALIPAATAALVTEATVAEIKRMGLASVDDGELVFDEEKLKDPDTRSKLQTAAKLSVLKSIDDGLTNEKDNEENQQSPDEGEGKASAFSAGQEQKEADNGPGDVSVSSPVAA